MKLLAALIACLAPIGLALAADPDLSKLPAPATRPVSFSVDIKPIFDGSCIRCHGPERPKSHFRLDNRESALKGGDDGDDIIPGASEKSRLIWNVARLDPDTAMPPEEKGTPLTQEQIAILRAWIDQGAPWDADASQPEFTVNLTQGVGFAIVHGNAAKFREQWGPDRWRGGIESFNLTEAFSPTTKLTLDGHAVVDDYRFNGRFEKQDVGFIGAGFQQYRVYESDLGGSATAFGTSAFSVGRDLHLDDGRSWLDLGLTLPNWPRMTLGYEFRYRNGDRASLEWGPVTAAGTTNRIYPGYTSVNEHTHILKFDLDYERGDWRIEDNFRGEWESSQTIQHNVYNVNLNPPPNTSSSTVKQGWNSFQGANTVRVDRRFKDWLYGSAGYLYSQLDGDANFSLNQVNSAPLPLSSSQRQVTWMSDQIPLERMSHVGNLNVLIGPWKSWTLSADVQSEWTRQNGSADGAYDVIRVVGAPVFTPVNFASSLDRATLSEDARLRFTGLPYTAIYFEGRLEQESIEQTEGATNDVYHFLRRTDASSQTKDFRAGFDTSPFTWLTLASHYRYYDKGTSYDDHHPNPDTTILGYPTFIAARRITTQEVESRLVLRPASWIKTTFTHRIESSDFETAAERDPFGGALSAGGLALVGNYDANTFSFNVAVTPTRRLYLSTTASYEYIRSASAHNNSPDVAPYRGDIYTVLAHGQFVLTAKTDLTAGYSYSMGDFQQSAAAGLPTGLNYQLHGVQGGLVSRLTKNVTTRLQYGYYLYRDEAAGGAANYTAHMIFASMSMKFK